MSDELDLVGSSTQSPLVGALREIEREAKSAQDRLARGESKNGTSALKRIEYSASDALARAGAAK